MQVTVRQLLKLVVNFHKTLDSVVIMMTTSGEEVLDLSGNNISSSSIHTTSDTNVNNWSNRQCAVSDSRTSSNLNPHQQERTACHYPSNINRNLSFEPISPPFSPPVSPPENWMNSEENYPPNVTSSTPRDKMPRGGSASGGSLMVKRYDDGNSPLTASTADQSLAEAGREYLLELLDMERRGLTRGDDAAILKQAAFENYMEMIERANQRKQSVVLSVPPQQQQQQQPPSLQRTENSMASNMAASSMAVTPRIDSTLTPPSTNTPESVVIIDDGVDISHCSNYDTNDTGSLQGRYLSAIQRAGNSYKRRFDDSPNSGTAAFTENAENFQRRYQSMRPSSNSNGNSSNNLVVQIDSSEEFDTVNHDNRELNKNGNIFLRRQLEGDINHRRVNAASNAGGSNPVPPLPHQAGSTGPVSDVVAAELRRAMEMRWLAMISSASATSSSSSAVSVSSPATYTAAKRQHTEFNAGPGGGGGGGGGTPTLPPYSPAGMSETSISSKDDAYWERRRKNNEAAKRSRDSRRAKEERVAHRAAMLAEENLQLRAQIAILKTETTNLHRMLYNRI